MTVGTYHRCRLCDGNHRIFNMYLRRIYIFGRFCDLVWDTSWTVACAQILRSFNPNYAAWNLSLYRVDIVQGRYSGKKLSASPWVSLSRIHRKIICSILSMYRKPFVAYDFQNFEISPKWRFLIASAKSVAFRNCGNHKHLQRTLVNFDRGCWKK